MNLAPPSLAGLDSAHSISSAMRTDLAPLPCLDCYMVHQPTAIDTWLQHWLPLLPVGVAVFLVALSVVLWRAGWWRAGGQEPPQAAVADDEEVESLGGNSDAGS